MSSVGGIVLGMSGVDREEDVTTCHEIVQSILSCDVEVENDAFAALVSGTSGYVLFVY